MEKALEIKNLVKRYPQSNQNAVDGVSFDVHMGELFALLGVNGAGKSTIINIACTLIPKTAGEVTVNGLLLGKDDDGIRKSIGVVFQGNALDTLLTAEENLQCRALFYGLTKAESKKRIDSLAEKLTMSSFLKQQYGRLSGGQRRKCDIARALIAAPHLLILDEPTTGLDPQSRIDLWKTIEEIRRSENMTVLMTTHYMEEAASANKIAIIDNGKLLCCDTPQALKSRYSADTVKLIAKTEKRQEIEDFLIEHSLSYSFHVDTFSISMPNGIAALEFLPEVRGWLESVEILKGNMDSVFLHAVGRKFADE